MNKERKFGEIALAISGVNMGLKLLKRQKGLLQKSILSYNHLKKNYHVSHTGTKYLCLYITIHYVSTTIIFLQNLLSLVVVTARIVHSNFPV